MGTSLKSVTASGTEKNKQRLSRKRVVEEDDAIYTLADIISNGMTWRY
jgi:hypothetical protein